MMKGCPIATRDPPNLFDPALDRVVFWISSLLIANANFFRLGYHLQRGFFAAAGRGDVAVNAAIQIRMTAFPPLGFLPR
jgi:hypothetical protein